MKIFLDSASIEEIYQALGVEDGEKDSKPQGLLDGVTTNPSLVAKTKKKA